MRRSARLVVAFVGLAACEGVHRLLEAPPPAQGRLAVSIPTAAITVPQGTDQTIAATITKVGDVSGSIGVSVQGLPEGVTMDVGTVSSTGPTTETAVVTLHVGSGTNVGTYPLTIRAHVDGFGDGVAFLALGVTQPPNYSLSASKASLTIARGGVSPLSIGFTRTNFSTPITLALSGATGIGLNIGENPTTADSVSGFVTVASDVAPGTYAVTLRASAPGLSERTAAVSVTVISDAIQIVAPSSLATPQGTSASMAIVVNHAAAPGPIALTAENLPAGVAASFAPAAPTDNSSLITIAVAPTVGAGTYKFSIKGTASGFPTASADVTLTVVAAGIAISIDPQSTIVFQAGSASVISLAIARTNFTGAVLLTAEGVPAGLAVTPSPETVAGSAATVSVRASSSLAAGVYGVTIRALPSGFPLTASQTTTLSVTVRPAPPGDGNVLLDWSACIPPEWVAYQDGTGDWTQAAVVSGLVRFNVNNAKGAFAYAEGGNTLGVRYMTQAELTAKAINMCPVKPGPKTITGTALFPLTGGSETINLGGGFAVASAGAGNFRIAGVNEGTHDLVVWGLAGPATRAVIRRDLNIPDNGTVGTVDLTSEESFAAVSNVLSVQGGAAGEAFSYSLNYLTTPACTVNQLGNTATFFGVPSSVQRPDDFHMHTVTASTSTRSRSVTNVYHLATNRVANLPPVFTAPVISAVAGSYKRLRAFFPADIPTPYNTGITLRYSNGAKLMFVSASLGYTSTSAVNILMPDLGAVSGFPFTYAIPSDFSGQWSVYIEGATGTQLCTEGLQKVLMTHAGVF